MISGWAALETIYLTRKCLRLREKDRGYQAVVRTMGSRSGALGVGPEYRPVLRTRREAHEVALNLSALGPLGWAGAWPACHAEYDEPFWPLPERFAAAVAPGYSRREAARARRAWPHWERFCDLLHERTGREVVLLGEEEDEAAWMNDPRRTWLHNLCGMTSIRGAAGVIARCETLYAIDNALGWIGAALGRPVVSLFGPTDEATRTPPAKSVRTVCSTLFCRPCRYSSRWGRCEAPRCMGALLPEEVLDAVTAEEVRVAG